MLIGSMCTGYGGLDMAVQAVFGGEIAWHAEVDPDASVVLAHRYPDVPNLGDITAVRWQDAARVDLVCAGFPCTDLSYAGHGEGIQEGNRSGLWYPIADALGVLRPRLVVLENVAAIVGRRPGLDVVLADLARLGFDAEWTCVRASDIGAPHGRDRWFLVAASSDTGSEQPERRRVAGVLGGTPTAEPREEDQRQRSGNAARRGGTAPADATDLGHERGRGTRGRRTGSTDGRLVAADAPGDRHGHAGPASVRGLATATVAGTSADANLDERTREPREQSWGAAAAGGGCDSAADADGRGRRSEPREQRRERAPERVATDIAWGAYEPAIRRWESVVDRPAPHPTEPGRHGKPRLSPRFVEWMMGLPAGHVTAVPGISRNAQLRLLGNGVVPQQGAAALRDLAVSA